MSDSLTWRHGIDTSDRGPCTGCGRTIERCLERLYLTMGERGCCGSCVHPHRPLCEGCGEYQDQCSCPSATNTHVTPAAVARICAWVWSAVLVGVVFGVGYGWTAVPITVVLGVGHTAWMAARSGRSPE